MTTRRAALVAWCVGLGAACTSPDPKPDPNPTDLTSNNLGGDPKPDGAKPDGAKPEWNCAGNLTPPTGWEQETAFADGVGGGPTQQASDTARSRLLTRLCSGASGCDDLERIITVWKTGQGEGKVCAMAVAEAGPLREWRESATSLGKLDASLEGVAKELLGGRLAEGKRPKVAIDKILDGGAPGGLRAEWLGKRMTRALNKAGASVLDVPQGWNGRGLPPGVEVLVTATTVTRSESGVPVVEVSWEAKAQEKGGLGRLVADAVTFPAAAAPAMESPVPPIPPSDSKLTVRVESRHSGGGLCLGERTQLWLYSEADLDVRVFDLYGKDGAFLLFPNPDRPDGRVRAGETIPLGGEGGFEAIPAPGFEVERFLVLAAPAAKGLGRYQNSKGYCRVPAHLAAQLHNGQGFPAGAKAASDGFRIAQNRECPAAPSLDEQKKMSEALLAFPECQ